MKPKSTYNIKTKKYSSVLEAFFASKYTINAGVTVMEGRDNSKKRSWSELVQRAQRRATRLKNGIGVQPGDVIGLAISNSHEFIESFFAIWMNQAIPVVLSELLASGDTEKSNLSHVINDTEMLCILVDKENCPAFIRYKEYVPVHEVAFGTLRDVPLMPMDSVHIEPENIALIQYTSGSTSRPRGVVLTHKHIAENCFCSMKEYNFGKQAAAVSWLPMYHDMGLIGELMNVVYNRIPFFLMSPMTFLHDPLLWLETISEHQCTITHVPSFALAYCLKRASFEDIRHLDLRSLSGLFLGGEPIDVKNAHLFIERFQTVGLQPQCVLGAYGLAESTVCVTRGQSLSGMKFLELDTELLAEGKVKTASSSSVPTMLVPEVGKVIVGHKVAIVNEKGELSSQGEIGEVWVSGPSVMKSYWKQPVSTRDSFVHFRGSDWLKTGDLGFLNDDRLFICGRKKEVIIIRGKNYHPAEIERVVEEVDGIRQGGCIAFGTKVHRNDVIVVLCEHDPKMTTSGLCFSIRKRVAGTVGLKVHHIELIPLKSLPKTSSGKKQRTLAKKLWLRKGTWS